MSFDFTGKRVIVCGGSKGIGRSVALGFAQAGAAVSICARGAEALAATKAELGPKAHAASCDLADGEAVRQWVNGQVGKTQRLSALRVMDELPRSAIGKILKRELRDAWQA